MKISSLAKRHFGKYILLMSVALFACTSKSKTSNINPERLSQNFKDSTYGVTSSYPSNWTSRKPERKATLLLLYENNGSQATCNLSVVAQDKEEISEYDSSYFANNLTRVYKTIDNLNTEFKKINDQLVSWTSYDFVTSVNNNDIHGKCVTVTVLNKGQRLMLIINVPKDNVNLIENDIKLITESLITTS
jgi:hypothetical protein